MWHFRSFVFTVTILFCAARPALGDQTSSKTIVDSMDNFPFQKGATEVQAVTGPFFHLAPTGNPRPRTNFIQAGMRYGWMLSTPGKKAMLRGNFEFLLEVFGAGIYEGPGNYLVGADMMFRYNFVRTHARLIPYIQTVTGGLYNDVYKTKTQGLLDTPGEFYLGADLGLRWLLKSNFAITGEFGYRHISNANVGQQNLGLNSLGVTLGVSIFY